ncbi:MAG TPA: 5'-nucleotidase C-terminal domain-containing protein, partial [Azospirillaceae bacterium]|nr:5'-nucleotidase C-terminal domain-containing protein [Azospirillaceae bacterium]
MRLFPMGAFVWLLAATMLSCLPFPVRAEATGVTLLYAHTTKDLEPQARGGLGRLATIIRRERQASGNVFVLHGGETLAPGVMSFFDQGAHVIDLLNGLEIDVMAALNREFHFGEDSLMSRAYEANFPVVSTNSIDPATGKVLEGLEDSAVLKAGPYRIGVLVATPQRTKEVTRVSRVEFPDPVATLQAKAKVMRADGVSLIVVLTTHGDDVHQAIIDAGLADIVLFQDQGAVIDVGYTGKILKATVDQEARWVLALDLTLDTVEERGGKQMIWSPSVRVIDTASVPPDPAVVERMKTYRDRLDAQLGVQVARLDAPMETARTSVRGGENAFANLAADYLREAMGADAALLNGGAIRGDRQYAAGTMLTRRDINAELPFPNITTLIEATGQQIWDALEVAAGSIEELHGRFLHVSNMKVAIDLTRPKGQRLADLQIAGRPVDRAARYRVATVDFIAGGRDGYGMLASAPRLVDEKDGD